MQKLSITAWGNRHEISLSVRQYSNKNLAISMTCYDEGYPEPYGSLTVNLDIPCDSNCAYVDVNNCGRDICQWIESNKLGHPTGKIKQSGYVMYPEYCFDLDYIHHLMKGGD